MKTVKILVLFFVLLVPFSAFSQDTISTQISSGCLGNLRFVEMCKPNAGFTFSILLSNPIQIDLISTATNADSIIWKGVSKYSLTDTIIGTGISNRIIHLNNFLVNAYECKAPPCPNTIDIKQIVINSCGSDSITIAVPVDNYTLIESKSGDILFFYPNPTSGIVNFKRFMNGKPLKYLVLDSNGRELIQGSLETEIYFNLPNGIYFLLISDKDRIIHNEKLVIKNRP